MVIKKINKNKIKHALELVLKVFMEYEAPDYSDEGIESFKKTAIYNEEYISNIIIYGAYENDKIVGMIATRNKGNHIALFFVDGQYHRRGIGRMLFENVLSQSTADEITVNSSPYAKEVYHHLGFEDTAPEQNTGGIRYIPMVYKKNLSCISSLIQMLENKDTSEAYKALQELEKISDETDKLYVYIERFVNMIFSDKYVVRVRGFRLFCKQAKWDRDNTIDENIDAVLCILNDEKPTAVRQALTALLDIVRYKPDLIETVKKAVTDINYMQYKDTMHSLIAKDIQGVLSLIKEVGEISLKEKHANFSKMTD